MGETDKRIKQMNSSLTNRGKRYEGASKVLNWRTIGKTGPTSQRGGGEASPRKERELRTEGCEGFGHAKSRVTGEFQGEPLMEYPTSSSKTRGQWHSVSQEIKQQCFELGHFGAGGQGGSPLV